MATAKKAPAKKSSGGTGNVPMDVVLPRTLVTGARSKAAPRRSVDKGERVQTQPLWPVLNTTIREKRAQQSVTALLRDLARSEGPFSTAVHNLLEIAYSGYKIFAYENDSHQFSSQGTNLALSIMASMDTPVEYLGTTKKRSIDATVKTLLRETLLTGGLSAELVLNKQRLPDRVQIVGIETLVWMDDGEGGVYPAQEIAGEDDPIELDIPTFFFDLMSPDPDTINPRSMMEACLKVLVYFEEFMEDVRRSVRISGHNRTTVTLNWEKLAGTAPMEIKNDPVKLRDYMISLRDGVQRTLETIEPDQALVLFDGVQADVLQSGHGVKIDYTPLLNVVVGQYATSMKTPPSVLGLRLEGGSAQMGSVESLIFLKTAKALHMTVETIMSRILTLACRLYGADVYVWFRMNPIDLRPENELEAFKSMRQSRLERYLSMGLISDDEFAVELDCFPRPAGAPDLSGTLFAAGKNDITAPAGSDAARRDLQPDKDAPRKAGGRSQ